MVDICVMLILLIVDCFQKDDIDCFNVILQCGLYWNTFTVRVHIHWTIWFVCTCICLIFFKDIFKYPLIIKVPFYFAIISWHALVFCSLSRHWYLRSQSLTSWMIHTPKVKCSKESDCGSATEDAASLQKLSLHAERTFKTRGCTSDMYTYLMYNICKKRPFTISKYVK